MIKIKFGDKYFNDPQVRITCDTVYSDDEKKVTGWREVWHIRDRICGEDAAAISAEIEAWRAQFGRVDCSLIMEDAGTHVSYISILLGYPEYGPRVSSFTLPDENGVFKSNVWFDAKFEAFWVNQDTDGIVDQGYWATWDTDENGVCTQTLKGFIKTAKSTSATTRFHEFNPPTHDGAWRVREILNVDHTDTEARYEITFRQIPDALPVGTVEGHATTTTHTDEDGLTIVTVQGKFKGDGAATAALEAKPSGDGIFIFEQEVEPDVFDNSTRFKYVYRRNKNSDPGGTEPNLLAMVETLTIRQSCDNVSFVTINYPNQEPYKFVNGTQTCVAEQSGYAVGLDAYPDPPAALFDAEHFSQRPSITYHCPTLNPDGQFINWKVEWKYYAEFASDSTVPGLLDIRPNKRTLYE